MVEADSVPFRFGQLDYASRNSGSGNPVGGCGLLFGMSDGVGVLTGTVCGHGCPGSIRRGRVLNPSTDCWLAAQRHANEAALVTSFGPGLIALAKAQVAGLAILAGEGRWFIGGVHDRLRMGFPSADRFRFGNRPVDTQLTAEQFGQQRVTQRGEGARFALVGPDPIQQALNWLKQGW